MTDRSPSRMRERSPEPRASWRRARSHTNGVRAAASAVTRSRYVGRHLAHLATDWELYASFITRQDVCPGKGQQRCAANWLKGAKSSDCILGSSLFVVVLVPLQTLLLSTSATIDAIADIKRSRRRENCCASLMVPRWGHVNKLLALFERADFEMVPASEPARVERMTAHRLETRG